MCLWDMLIVKNKGNVPGSRVKMYVGFRQPSRFVVRQQTGVCDKDSNSTANLFHTRPSG